MSKTKFLMESIQNNLNEEVEAEILRMYKADEHKQGDDGAYYTYLNIETDLLGDFYISFDIDQNKINTDGYPWEFLQKEEYQLTPEQKELVEANKEFIETTMAKNISWNKEGEPIEESEELNPVNKDIEQILNSITTLNNSIQTNEGKEVLDRLVETLADTINELGIEIDNDLIG